MMILTTSGKQYSGLDLVTILCDTEEEILTLPGLNKFHTGSLCLCVENDLLYTLGSDGRWHEI